VQVKEWGDGIVFLKRVEDGRSDRSYGIHVARIAGLPLDVVERAQEILVALEANDGSPRTAVSERPCVSRNQEGGADRGQLSIFGQVPVAVPESNRLHEELAALNPNEMRPIDALTLIVDWKKRYVSSRVANEDGDPNMSTRAMQS
jgi:DNA mismatch repair protein MutS